jgi:hypothetical protein
VQAESHGILEFAARTKLMRDRYFEEFEGKTRVDLFCRRKAQKEGLQVIWQDLSKV